MSVDSQSTITHAPKFINLSEKFSGTEQQDINHLLDLLPVDDLDSNNEADAKQAPINIVRFVDGRGLACPMPLLKTKVALRYVATGESLYVVATDANSQADIAAFCRQSKQAGMTNRLLLTINSVTNQQTASSTSPQRFDTIYHFIITKTDSN